MTTTAAARVKERVNSVIEVEWQSRTMCKEKKRGSGLIRLHGGYVAAGQGYHTFFFFLFFCRSKCWCDVGGGSVNEMWECTADLSFIHIFLVLTLGLIVLLSSSGPFQIGARA